jgi:small subunit ribosomal protein S6
LRDYEVMLILPPEADEQAVSRVIDRITQVLVGSGGRVGKVERWGRRRLAYEIGHQSEGYYLIVEFGAEPGAIRELERVLSLADDVIRFKTLVRAA